MLKGMEQEKLGFENSTVQYLVQIFYQNWLRPNPTQYTTACSVAIAVAKQFRDVDEENKLNSLHKNVGKGFHLGLLESVYFRDYSFGLRLDKTYNYGYKMKPISLAEIIILLSNAKKKIFDSFTKVCIDNEVKMPLALPFFTEDGA